MGVQLQKLRKRYPKASTAKLKQYARRPVATSAPPKRPPAYHVGIDLHKASPQQQAGFTQAGLTPQNTPPSQMLYPGQKPKTSQPAYKPPPPKPTGSVPKPVPKLVNVPPPDPLYDTAVARLNRDRTSQESEFAYQEGQTKQDYGIDDPTNPYSRAKALERTFLQSKRGTSGSYAARGQLYSGALQNALGEARYGYDASYDSLSRSYQQALHGYAQGRTTSQTAYSDALAQAEQDRVNRALSKRPEDPGIPAVPKPPATPKPAKPGAKKKVPVPTKATPSQAAQFKAAGMDPQMLANWGAGPGKRQVLTDKGYVTPGKPKKRRPKRPGKTKDLYDSQGRRKKGR